MQESVDRLWLESATWFGPPDDAAFSLLHSEGILNADAAIMRERFFERVEELLGGDDIKLPVRREGDSWQVEPDLSWDNWDAAARRLPAKQL